MLKLMGQKYMGSPQLETGLYDLRSSMTLGIQFKMLA